MSTPPRFEPDKACGECGQFGAYDFGDELLCMDCYQHRGSCCAERELAETQSMETDTETVRKNADES